MINKNIFLSNLWGIGLVVCRILDGFKYIIEANKIRQVKTAKGHSRDFGNVALGVDIFMFCYFIFHNFDIYMIISTFIILCCVLYYWWTLYIYYPYRTYPRKVVIKKIIKRPSIWVYFLNSLERDSTKRHL